MRQRRNVRHAGRPIARARPPRHQPPRILLTGFGPFPGVPVNPTERIVAAAARRLARAHKGAHVAAEVFPTEWAMLANLPDRLAVHRPDVVVMTGVAVRARTPRIERIAHAHADAALSDASGSKAHDLSKSYAHRAPRRSEVDVARLKRTLIAANLRIAHSDDPGRYLCNAAYLTALDWARTRRPRPPVVFVHVPPPRLGPGLRERDLVETVVRVAEALAGGGRLRRGAVRPA